MKMENTKKINEVCRMLDMTSRTIRYYEQCRLIKTIRESSNAPRRLDSENIERLQKIRFLRKLGLSIDEISVIIDDETKAVRIIYGKVADYVNEISTLKKRIKFLEDVVTTVESGGDIYAVGYDTSKPEENVESGVDIHAVGADSNISEEEREKLRIASEITAIIIEGRFSEIQAYGNDLVKKFTPDLLGSVWNKILLSNGNLISVGEQTIEGNIVTTKLHFEKRSIDLKIDISVGVVTGLLFQSNSI